MKQCLFFWGSIPSEGGGQFTLQPGTAPSRGTLRFRLGVNLPQFENLTITDSYSRVVVGGCRVVRWGITGGGSGGRFREVTIEDRRWRWQRAWVWGDHNTVENNIIVKRTKRSARELAKDCLEAMGESNYDVSALPDNSYPATTWSAEPAAAALESLCAQYGCLVVPKFSGRIVIYKDGYGRRPPLDYRAMDATASSEPQVIPDALVFEGGETLWQHDLALEPVGFESFSEKAEIKPIDELSYKPANGWEREDPKSFLGVTAKKRELAKACIWKLFRVKDNFQLPVPPSALQTSSGKLTVGQTAKVLDYFRIKEGELWRILPLETNQLSMYKKPEKEEGPPARILGYFRDEKHGMSNNSTAALPAWISNADKAFPETVSDELVYEGGFSIDTVHGLVKISNPLYYNEIAGNRITRRVAPHIRLRTSFGLRDRETRAHLCQQYWYTPPMSSRQGVAELVKRPESIFEISSIGSASSVATTTNVSDYVAQAIVYLREQLNSYYPDDAISVPYKGFVFDVELDGAVRAVSWSVSPRGEGTSQVEYLNERPDLRITHRDLRAKILDDAARRQRPQAAKQVKKDLKKAINRAFN